MLGMPRSVAAIEEVCRASPNARFFGDRYDWTTGAPQNGNEWKKYLFGPREQPSRLEAKGLLAFQGQHGITSVVRWNLRPRGSFWDGRPADIRGSFARISRPKTSVRAVKILENKYFGADIHDPKARTSTILRDFQKLRSEKLWAGHFRSLVLAPISDAWE